jgi:hypothetical protein
LCFPAYSKGNKRKKPVDENIRLIDLLKEQLQDESLATLYLEEYLADENIDLFKNALKDVADAITDDQLKTMLSLITFSGAEFQPILAAVGARLAPARDLVSAFVQEELVEQEWDAIVAKPPVMKRMVELARKARQEYLEGNIVKGGFGRE